MEKNFWNFTGLRKKLIIFYLVMTLLMGITSLYTYYSAPMIMARLNTVFIDYVYLNDLNMEISSLEANIEKYLTTKSSEALLEYYNLNNKLQERAVKLSREKGYDKSRLMLKDIGNMITSLLQEADATVNAKRGRISSEYLAHFTETNKIAGYIKLYINELLYNKLQEGSQKYEQIRDKIVIISYINFFLIAGSLLVNVFLAMFFTYKITRPIIELSHAAARVSRGDFDVEPVIINTDDEVNVLAGAFNEMVINIKNYIAKIKYQAEVERKLKEQEMQNLKMKSLLKEAQLKSLQSQINPHFLFNTLNAASQLAMMEGADKSALFIENVANLFRYNLKRLDKPVTLQDEINNARAYMFILKTRFGDKIDFYTDIDEIVLHVAVPCMVVQPIIENAFLHGIENMERNGRIDLNVKRRGNYIAVEISDNGRGMEAEVRESILAAAAPDHFATEGHVSGIGLQNVISRMMLFYNAARVADVIEIDSRKNTGTRVILKIPLPEEGTRC